MIKMENDVLSVEIAEHGAELTKLYNKKTGTDLLWDAEPKFWKRHSPVLFPNVGKTYKNTVKINGTHYPTSQHGFARDSFSGVLISTISFCISEDSFRKLQIFV